MSRVHQKHYVGDIPFHRDHLCHYAGEWERDVVWKNNFKFHGRLLFKGFSRGRSAAYAVFVRLENGVQRGEVGVFLKDLGDMIAHPKWKGGIIEAEFTFCKRGQNFGCQLV